ncbi:sodium/pantothenate symporter [Zobellella denitrificans]|jgi:sodium/pantothenate symporter|uniref:Sodium/panthothenate symporter n=1 Tax=Zobellella denitrificans TaxID=347534 RepID=A0A291HLU3_9GAMM|nr:sodium/pantothenate symporter [Zobellella denitrificans]ATG73127.1 sodium/panthothenate symporter [Zobellella denitrificans]
MNPELLLPLVIYLAAMLGLGVWLGRRPARGGFVQDYFLGNRSMGGFVLAMTMVATYASASSFIGGPGAAYRLGLGWVLLAMIQVPTVWLTLGVLGKQFAHIARRVEALTINDMLRARYQSPLVVVLAALGLLAAFVATMVVQFIGGARLLETVTGLPYEGGLVLFAVTVLLYTLIGGFRAVVITDAVQGVLMLLGTLVLLAGVLHAGGGAAALFAGLAEIDPGLVRPQGPDEMLGISFMLSFWVLVCFGVIGLPHSAVRCLAYKDSAAMHRGIVIGTLVGALLMFGMHFAGALGRVLVPDLTVPDKVMPTLMLAVLPPLVAGLFLAGPMAAIMSTIDSQLIQASATLVKDLYLNYLSRTPPSPAAIKGASRLVTLVLGLVVLWAALSPPDMIIWLNLMAFGALQAIFFWPLVLGLYWWRGNSAGALASMVTGALGYGLLLHFGIKPLGLHAIVPSLALSGLAYVLGSLLTAPPPDEVRRLFGRH